MLPNIIFNGTPYYLRQIFIDLWMITCCVAMLLHYVGWLTENVVWKHAYNFKITQSAIRLLCGDQHVCWAYCSCACIVYVENWLSLLSYCLHLMIPIHV